MFQKQDDMTFNVVTNQTNHWLAKSKRTALTTMSLPRPSQAKYGEIVNILSP